MSKRKSYAYLTTKIYGGGEEHKTLAIRFEPKDKDHAIMFARAVLQAVEYGKGVTITVFKYRKLKDGSVAVTVTSPA